LIELRPDLNIVEAWEEDGHVVVIVNQAGSYRVLAFGACGEAVDPDYIIATLEAL
jgi:hypothetical protein